MSNKKREVWHKLLGGSMTVIPKSFVQNPLYKGFSNIELTRHSIIVSLGNLIRIYDFNTK